MASRKKAIEDAVISVCKKMVLKGWLVGLRRVGEAAG